MGENPIICFQHCERNINIFCLTLPVLCPICGLDLETTESRIPPFRVPSPFTYSNRAPLSIVIKPTVGTFLQEYKNSSDLHIGVTSSKGLLYDYNENGMSIDKVTWEQCLSIPLFHKPSTKCQILWDRTLNEFSQQEEWTSGSYDDQTHNCYDFALGFLKHAQMHTVFPCISCKVDFTSQLILPKTTRAGKYISLYRQVLSEKILLQERPK